MHSAAIYLQTQKNQTCYAINYIGMRSGLAGWVITVAGHAFQRIRFLNQNEYAGPAKAGFFISHQNSFVENQRGRHLSKTGKMLSRQYIFLHRTCPLGYGQSLSRATAWKTIGNDPFNGRMENVYPHVRPRCMQTQIQSAFQRITKARSEYATGLFRIADWCRRAESRIRHRVF